MFVYDYTVPPQPGSPILFGNVTAIFLIVSAGLTAYFRKTGTPSEADALIEKAIPGHFAVGADDCLMTGPRLSKPLVLGTTICQSNLYFFNVFVLPPPRTFLILLAFVWTLVVLSILKHVPRNLHLL